MAVIREGSCAACGNCLKLCRFDAIRKDGDRFTVDPLACEGCGVCVRFCPEESIDFPEPAHGVAVTARHHNDEDKPTMALRKVVAEGISAEALARAKRQKVADWVYSQQTADDIASTLATDYMSTGDVLFSKNYSDRIQAITVEQVNAMAKK